IDVTTPNSTTKQVAPKERNQKQKQPIKKTPPPIDVTTPNSTTKQVTPKVQNPKHRLRKKTPPLSHNDHQSTSTCLDHDDEDDVMGKIPEGHIRTWSTADVVEFISPRDCKKFADVFLEQEVDGKALMLLSLDDIHKVLGVTLGPAIKLHDDVQKLRRRSR
ncbi:scm-like with four MBT domains protein 1, partial [Actinia tenebrosa]|uniref:Scm-like with four MBT domains protein 1 n=1 Tax=Actinia tenebrosa TaxID=6105 RepID=A0A6P8IHS0_ACTTE